MSGPTPTNVIFHSGASWAPQSEITEYRFDFGDGAEQRTVGTGVRFVAQHNYSPGTYRACVSITDQRGRTAQLCTVVEPGILTIIVVDGQNTGGRVTDASPTKFFDKEPLR